MRNGTFPRKIVLLLLLAPLPFFVLSFWAGVFLWAGFGIDAAVVLYMVLDMVVSPNYKKDVVISVELPASMGVRTANRVGLKVRNKNRFPIRFCFILELDVSFDRDYSRELVTVYPGETRVHEFNLFALRRGEFSLKTVSVRALSLLGSLYIYRKFAVDAVTNVTPSVYTSPSNFKLIQKLIRRSEGSQRNRMLGDGTNFEMLRDYIKGDEYSKIDWKATARKRKPVTRVYRMENNFNISILLDCGRIMASEVTAATGAASASLLDYAVDASLVLAYAAARGSDSVSCTAFGREIIRYMAPAKDLKTVRRMNSLLSGLQYELYESNYQNAFSFLQARLSKRSLVILFTDIIDDSNVPVFHKNLSHLQRYHMVLLILLRDRVLFETAARALTGENTIYGRAACYDLILRRNRSIASLKRLGVEVLDLYPEQVSAEVISNYFRIKNRM